MPRIIAAVALPEFDLVSVVGAVWVSIGDAAELCGAVAI